MRHNHFSMLPERAFEKRGFGFTRPATLEGGGGGIVSSIGKAVEGVGSSIGHAVEGVGKSVSNIGVGIDKSVNKAVPGGWVTVGALAAAALTAGVASGAFLAAEGAGAVGAAEAGAAAAGAGAAEAGAGAAAAAGAAEAGAAADVFAGLAAAGEAGAGAATPFSWAGLGESALAGAAKGAAINGGMAAVNGGDVGKAALMGGLTGAVGGGFGNAAGQMGAGAIGSGVAGGAGASAAGALANGKDAGNAALIGGITGGITGGLNDYSGIKLGTALSPVTKFGVSNLINGAPQMPTGRLLGAPAGMLASRYMNPASSQYTAQSQYNPQSSYGARRFQDLNNPYNTSGMLDAGMAGVGQDNSLLSQIAKPRYMASGGVTSQRVGNTETNLPQSSTAAKGVLQGNIDYTLIDKLYSPEIRQYAEGGEIESHNPEFFSEGGLNSLENTYVKGDGDGTSDSVPAMLANGEFVIPADVVASLGNGSNDSGSKVLSEFLSTIREHKQKHDSKKLPPDSNGPLAYLTDAKRKLKV